MPERNQKANEDTKSLLKASWMRSSIKLALIATVSGLIAIWLLKVFNVAGMQLFSDMSAFFVNYGLAGIFLVTIAAGTIIPLAHKSRKEKWNETNNPREMDIVIFPGASNIFELYEDDGFSPVAPLLYFGRVHDRFDLLDS